MSEAVYLRTPFDQFFDVLLQDGTQNCTAEEITQINEVAGLYAQERLAPIADYIHFQLKAFPHEEWKEMAALMLKGIIIPKEYGGMGLGYMELAIVTRQLSKRSGSVALSYIADQALCAHQIMRYGDEEQKEKFLTKLASGDFIGALAMSDVDAGSDVAAMNLHAAKDGDDYILNGTKYWITNGARVDEKGNVIAADVTVVYAVTSEEPFEATAFLVEPGMEGFSVEKIKNKVGMAGSDTAELKFDHCRIPKKNILGKVGKGFNILMSGLNAERLILAAGAMGLAEQSWEDSLKYLKTRKTFGMNIIFNQSVADKSSDTFSQLLANYDHLFATARRADKNPKYLAGITGNSAAGSVFLRSSILAVEAAIQNVRNHGGSGITTDYGCMRILTDALLYANGGGSEAMRLRRISEATIEFYRENLKLVQTLREAVAEALDLQAEQLEEHGKEILEMLQKGLLQIVKVTGNDRTLEA